MSSVRRSSCALLARATVLALVASLAAGCAATQKPNYVQGPRSVAADPMWTVKVEIEEDGKPGQLPPVRRAKPLEDDPTQPWSPNYGRTPPAPAAATEAPTPPPVRAQRSAAWWPFAPAGMSDRQADAVVAEAIAAHEIRRQ
jgi:hypothetical protein